MLSGCNIQNGRLFPALEPLIKVIADLVLSGDAFHIVILIVSHGFEVGALDSLHLMLRFGQNSYTTVITLFARHIEIVVLVFVNDTVVAILSIKAIHTG